MSARILCGGLILVAGFALATASGVEGPPAIGGQLQILDDKGGVTGACPLRHTDVSAEISGFVGRVHVTQIYQNPTDRKIEAVYVFPLPSDAAVDEMVMTVGDRRIVGQIKERGEAREIYETAKAAGHVASLLDQEQPNIFTQSVANIEPGVEVVIEISYAETVRYEDGVYEWVFPMVVGPRYIPGGGSAPAPMTKGQDTPQVPDASRITPPVTPEGTRAGHDISLEVTIFTGMPIFDVKSELYDIDAQAVDRQPNSAWRVALRDADEIPNRDFVLHYRTGGDEIGDAFLVHGDERGTFFAVLLQPPQRVVPAQLMARELIFVLDTSGSMSGFPIEKAKQVMHMAIDQMRPADTFNLITFAGDTHILWDAPRPATAENIAAAQAFLESREGRGGTEMMKAINAALMPVGRRADVPASQQPIRVVCFMTDGYVGDAMTIIDAVKKNAGTTRVFSFGIGNSVNRFLLDGMARAGRGEVEYVMLESQGDAAAERFHERILAPVLTDIEIDWGELPVADVYPTRIPDLFAARPIMVRGRLTGLATGIIALRGNTGAGPYESQIEINVPENAQDHEALASLWARARVEDLMMQDYAAAQSGQFPDELRKQVIDLGIEFRLMTQFTSFVAVEEMTVTVGGEPVRVDVPVEMPAGVSYEGVFGRGAAGFAGKRQLYAPRRASGGARGVVLGGATGRPAPTAPPPMPLERAGVRELGDEEDELTVEEQTPASRLDEVLRDLAAKVEKDGQEGNLTLGKLKVTAWRVDVMIYLSDNSEKTLAALTELSFKQTGESKAVKLVVGTIDVRQLMKLVELEAVIRVRPVVAP